MSSRLICFTLFTRLWWTGLTGLASAAHVLLHQAQCGLWVFILMSLVSLLFKLLAAELTQLFHIKGDFLEPFR